MAIDWLKINGVTMPCPCEITPVWADFDSEKSVRSETGRLNRDVIRTNVRSPEYSFKLKTADMHTLLNAIKNPPFSVTYPDPLESNYTGTISNAYAQATRKAKFIHSAGVENIEDAWWEFSCAFIEY